MLSLKPNVSYDRYCDPLDTVYWLSLSKSTNTNHIRETCKPQSLHLRRNLRPMWQLPPMALSVLASELLPTASATG